MTIAGLRRQIREQLAAAGIETADYDTRILMETYLGLSREDYLLEPDKAIEERMLKPLFAAAAERAGRKPLQQITGEAPFMGYHFHVNSHVLIPRMDTECLVEEALNRISSRMPERQAPDRSKRPVRLLDLCTGSGCIGISIKLLCPDLEVVLSDLSEDALAVAAYNADRLRAKVEICQGDLFEEVSGKFDYIVSNPPYIPSGEIPGLMPEVKDYEPWMALDGEEDGLAFYRRIVREAPSYMCPGGMLLMEIGAPQGQEIRALLEEAGYTGIRIGQDLAGLDRIIEGVWE